MSKWQIFLGGFETHNPWMIALVIFAALNSVLSLGYYAPLVNTMYRGEPSPAVQAGARVPGLMNLPLLLLVLLVVVLGVYPALINPLTQPAGAAILAGFGY
jgi:NADH:ubiquinone oxidoreductase subunit 2 (subunit N)